MRDLEIARLRFERQVDDMARDERRKLPLKKPSPTWQLQKAHRVELRWAEAQIKCYVALLEASRALECVSAAIIDARDAKIARLSRQLRIAKLARRRQRGWSTTRVRFAL